MTNTFIEKVKKIYREREVTASKKLYQKNKARPSLVESESDEFTLETTKGDFTGTAQECAKWLVKMQPPFVSIEDLPEKIQDTLTEDEHGFILIEDLDSWLSIPR